MTWRSSMASSSADCVFGEARLISSPSTMLAKIGPGRNSNSLVPRFQTVTPMTSEGSRSGVNWIRANVQSIERGQRLRQARLADAGDVLDQEVALGDQAQQRELDDLGLALDDPLDVVE